MATCPPRPPHTCPGRPGPSPARGQTPWGQGSAPEVAAGRWQSACRLLTPRQLCSGSAIHTARPAQPSSRLAGKGLSGLKPPGQGGIPAASPGPRPVLTPRAAGDHLHVHPTTCNWGLLPTSSEMTLRGSPCRSINLSPARTQNSPVVGWSPVPGPVRSWSCGAQQGWVRRKCARHPPRSPREWAVPHSGSLTTAGRGGPDASPRACGAEPGLGRERRALLGKGQEKAGWLCLAEGWARAMLGAETCPGHLLLWEGARAVGTQGWGRDGRKGGSSGRRTGWLGAQAGLVLREEEGRAPPPGVPTGPPITW
nr:uncharacterized protein LOC120361485 [Saimiri boliviensis boliviensis]XP_039319114.1 uncharacterized protein LOC120361485 [Saimiri boliviensis boliviensis]